MSKWRNNIYVFRAVSLCYMLFLGLRYAQGIDYFSYGHTYASQPTLSQLITGAKEFYPESFEIGYNLLVALLRQANMPYSVLVFCISVFTVYGLHRFIVRYSKNFMLSFMILYSIYGIMILESAYRQVIAMVILLGFTIPFLERKKYIYGIITIGIAYCFHVTSVVFSMVLILIYIEKLYQYLEKYWNLAVVGIGIPLIFMVNILGIKQVVMWMPLPAFIETKVVIYLSQSSGYSMVALAYRGVMFLIIMFALRLCNVEQKEKKLLYLLGLGYVIYFAMAAFPILSRITLYFEILEIAIVPTLLYGRWRYKRVTSAIHKRWIGYCTAGYMVIAVALFYNDTSYVISAGDYEVNYIPYITLFQKEEVEKYIDFSDNIYYDEFIYRTSPYTISENK